MRIQTDQEEIGVVTINHSRGKKIVVRNRPEIFKVVEDFKVEWPEGDDLDVWFKTFNDALDRFVHQGKAKVLIVCNPPTRFLISFWNKSMNGYRFQHKIDIKVLIHQGDSAIYTLP